MNILLVILIWMFLWYLFFHPLNDREYIDSFMDRTYNEYAEGYYGSDS
jgi:hypothetical protein